MEQNNKINEKQRLAYIRREVIEAKAILRGKNQWRSY